MTISQIQTHPSPQHQPQHQEEATFRNYDATAATKYARYRGGWSESFILEHIISPHTSSGGELDILLDVGCGPGNSTRCLAPHFRHVLGVDPSLAMVEAARGHPSVGHGTLGGGEQQQQPTAIRYEVGKAEELSSLPALADFIQSQSQTQPGSETFENPQGSSGSECVDLITAATAAHWFDMRRFWGEAARILKPGGSVILWCTGGLYVHPFTTPSYTKVQRLLDDFEAVVLAPFSTAGNALCRNLYAGLPLPWDYYYCSHHGDDQDGDGDEDSLGVKDSLQVLSCFNRERFTRLEFNKDGAVPSPRERFVQGWKADFNTLRESLATASPVVRWREAHGEQLRKGEVVDLLDTLIEGMKELFAEVDEGDGEGRRGGKGREWMDCGTSVGVLVVKKKMKI